MKKLILILLFLFSALSPLLAQGIKYNRYSTNIEGNFVNGDHLTNIPPSALQSSNAIIGTNFYRGDGSWQPAGSGGSLPAGILTNGQLGAVTLQGAVTITNALTVGGNILDSGTVTASSNFVLQVPGSPHNGFVWNTADAIGLYYDNANTLEVQAANSDKVSLNISGGMLVQDPFVELSSIQDSTIASANFVYTDGAGVLRAGTILPTNALPPIPTNNLPAVVTNLLFGPPGYILVYNASSNPVPTNVINVNFLGGFSGLSLTNIIASGTWLFTNYAAQGVSFGIDSITGALGFTNAPSNTRTITVSGNLAVGGASGQGITILNDAGGMTWPQGAFVREKLNGALDLLAAPGTAGGINLNAATGNINLFNPVVATGEPISAGGFSTPPGSIFPIVAGSGIGISLTGAFPNQIQTLSTIGGNSNYFVAGTNVNLSQVSGSTGTTNTFSLQNSLTNMLSIIWGSALQWTVNGMSNSTATPTIYSFGPNSLITASNIQALFQLISTNISSAASGITLNPFNLQTTNIGNLYTTGFQTAQATNTGVTSSLVGSDSSGKQQTVSLNGATYNAATSTLTVTPPGGTGTVVTNVTGASGDIMIGPPNAGNISVSGINNTGMGSLAGNGLTTGSDNTAIGFNALDFLQTGSKNTVVGSLAGNTGTTTAFQNTALGYNAWGSGGGSQNVALGAYTLLSGSAPSNNTAVGFGALSNSIGYYNTVVGWESGFNSTNGTNNIYIGANVFGGSDETNIARWGNSSITSNFFNGILIDTFSGLGTTVPSYGLNLSNSTVAASGLQQNSPGIVLSGNGWKTTSTAASQPDSWLEYNSITQGSTSPLGSLTFAYSVNNAAYTTYFTISPLSVSSLEGFVSTGGGFQANANATFGHIFSGTGNEGLYWVDATDLAVRRTDTTAVNLGVSGLVITTNGFVSYATNVLSQTANAWSTTVASLNSGYTNNGNGYPALVANVAGTSGSVIYWHRGGASGVTAAANPLWTNTITASGINFTLGTNCGFQVVSGIGVYAQVYTP